MEKAKSVRLFYHVIVTSGIAADNPRPHYIAPIPPSGAETTKNDE